MLKSPMTSVLKSLICSVLNVEISSIPKGFCHTGVQNSPFGKEEVLVFNDQL